ncbi:hypothetical protein FRC14_001917 [Serendipita sp. 396]|nr:hypothetical protein FRC14_001917 [Serendipita sp. 396]
MSEYGDIDSFDYNFSYQLMWTAFDLPTYEGAAGLPLSARLTVGTSSNKDNFVSTEPQAWADGKADLGEPFFHSGTTTFLKSADGNIAYIPITLDFFFCDRKEVFFLVLRLTGIQDHDSHTEQHSFVLWVRLNYTSVVFDFIKFDFLLFYEKHEFNAWSDFEVIHD